MTTIKSITINPIEIKGIKFKLTMGGTETIVTNTVDERYQNITPSLVSSPRLTRLKEYQDKLDILQRYVRQNKNSHFTELLVANPGFIPSQEDIWHARQNPNSKFTSGIFSNPNFKPRQEEISLTRDVSFIDERIKNPNYIPSQEEISFARQNPRTSFIYGIIKNPNFIPSQEDINFARQNRFTLFAGGLAANPNFIPSQEDIDFARQNLNTWFATGLVINPNFTPSQDDINIAHKNPSTNFAQIGDNPNFIPSQEDISFALQNPNTIFAITVLESQNLILNPEDISMIQEAPEPLLREIIARNPNFIPDKKSISLARKYPYRVLAKIIARNQNLTPSPEDIELVIQDIDSAFARGIASNPNLFLSREMPQIELGGNSEFAGYFYDDSIESFSTDIQNPSNIDLETISEAERNKMIEREALLKLIALAQSNNVNFCREEIQIGKSNHDIEWAFKHRNTEEAKKIVLQEDFHPNDEHIGLAKLYKSSYFAYIARNKNYIPTNEDLKFAYVNPNCAFTWNLVFNPNIKLEI